MALITIVQGSEIVSGVLNDNFEYLDDRIDTFNSSITTLQSNISSLNTTLNNSINSAVSTMNTNMYGMPSAMYISGLVISKTGNTSISISRGKCLDSTKSNILETTTDTSKFLGSLAANTVYYIYTTNNQGFQVTTNSSSPVTGTKYRQIGYVKTNDSGYIQSTTSYGVNDNDNKVTLVECSMSGTEWKKIYSNGWVEMGGRVGTSTYAAANPRYYDITLNPGLATGYSIHLTTTLYKDDVDGWDMPSIVCNYTNVSSDGFRISCSRGNTTVGGIYTFWEVKGFKV